MYLGETVGVAHLRTFLVLTFGPYHSFYSYTFVMQHATPNVAIKVWIDL
jgi:hypothetical protein